MVGDLPPTGFSIVHSPQNGRKRLVKSAWQKQDASICSPLIPKKNGAHLSEVRVEDGLSYPVASGALQPIYIVLLGIYLYLTLPAISSKFRCASCGRTFRRYTLSGWLSLGLLSVSLLIFLAPG